MNKAFLLLCVALLPACHSGDRGKAGELQTKFSTAPLHTKKVTHVTQSYKATTDDNAESEILPYYIVIADTGLNYDVLHQKMISINKPLKIKIDTLGRFYNPKKNLIQLPDNDPDEIYAGDYFLRRGEGESLSIEYLNAYKGSSNEKMMALLSGIYEKKSSADSALVLLKKTSASSFVLKADIYMGCMH
ncbi:hypothetical protein KXQ82_08260 [Mucilaginibacter sp. HMF5004]|uniref:hypothetical protein n=1 Tax=Mucilaginibacter rivuli TaxID=2857527 RepID=UPI001C5CF10F|nr:hypothetical protein [Mucilaginibacter rivuli]MBW4889706.1 hypothetical protein [Mucilaginibacter rivuli]